jgi:hypothetical protein
VNMRSGTQRDERRRRYVAKQETIAAGMPLHHKSTERVTTTTPHLDDDDDDDDSGPGNSCADTFWMNQHNHMCQVVTINDINLLKRYRMISDQNQADINSDDGELTFVDHDNMLPEMLHLDRLLSPYFDIQNKDLPSSKNKYDQRLRFIAEGTETVRLLILQLCSMRDQDDVSNTESLPWHDPIQIESVFMKQTLFFGQPVHLQNDVDIVLKLMQKRLSEQKHATTSPPPFHVLLSSMETMSAVAGFTVSRGCLACGYIPINRTEEWFFEKLDRHLFADASTTNGTFRLLALDRITDTANLGSMIRTASAFGIHAILLSNDCCDAWYRRSIRVSMGHIFRIPIVRVTNLSNTLHILSQPPYNVTSYAAIVDTKSSISLHQVKFGKDLRLHSQTSIFSVFRFY